MTKLFSSALSQPGYAGYFGPVKGGKSLIGFGTNASDASDNASKANKNWGFLAESYQLNFGRQVQVKHFLNTTLPAAVAGYANGTLDVTGMVGTYKAFENIINASSGDLCNKLVCVIKNGSSFTPCENSEEGKSGVGKGTEITCEGLIASQIRITGSVQQDGILYQQAVVQFVVSGVDIKEVAGTDDDYNEDEEDELAGEEEL